MDKLAKLDADLQDKKRRKEKLEFDVSGWAGGIVHRPNVGQAHKALKRACFLPTHLKLPACLLRALPPLTCPPTTTSTCPPLPLAPPQVHMCTVKLERASKLITGLGGEKVRWTQAAKSLGEQYVKLAGEGGGRVAGDRLGGGLLPCALSRKPCCVPRLLAAPRLPPSPPRFVTAHALPIMAHIPTHPLPSCTSWHAGDVLLAAGHIAYLGPFTALYRSNVLQTWVAACQAMSVPCGERFRSV